MRSLLILLRDGREVPFDKGAIASGVARALDESSIDDPQFALEVADVVEFAMQRSFGSGREGASRKKRIPTVDMIEDLVEKALVELGRTPIAKAYILDRARRDRVRDAERAPELTERGGERSDAERAALENSIKVSEASGTSGWSRTRIVTALMNEADLPRGASEEVAARVEARVFASGIKRIHTALIRELVDNELVDMGLSLALRRQGPVGIPRHDLRRLLDGTFVGRDAASAGARSNPASRDRSGARSFEGEVASEVLRRYSLEDVVPPHVADLHSAGDLSLEDVSRPHLFLTQAVVCEILLRGTPGPQSAFDLLDELARVAASTSRGVVLEAPGAALQPLIRGVRSDSSSGLGAWLAALKALGRASGKRFDLVGLGKRSGALIARLIEELARTSGSSASMPGGGPAPRLFLDPAEWAAATEHSPRVVRSAERLLRAGLLVPIWASENETFAGPGCHRARDEQGGLACGGAVCLNLVRLARRAGPWREDLLLEKLLHLVESSLDAIEALRSFQHEHRAARSGEVRGRVAYALSPVGLREALRILGDGELRAAQGARILGVLSEAARRFSAERGLSVCVSPFFASRARVRFFALDAVRPHEKQRMLFGVETEDTRGTDRGYSSGYDLSPNVSTEPGASEGVLLATVPTGALAPFPALMRGAFEDKASRFAGAAHSELPHVRSWERFQYARETEQSGGRSVAEIGGYAAAHRTATRPRPLASASSALFADTESEALLATTTADSSAKTPGRTTGSSQAPERDS